MVREDLVSLCENYVRSRDEAASLQPAPAVDPASEIVRSFRLAEISESEMQALLAYVDDSEEEDDSLAAEMEAAGISLHVYDGLDAATADDEDDDWQPGQPR
ncbi:MAG: hypothetical protein NTY17_09365 [Planctomycetia bacterium]|nr:hypothetical protein [Planctomycetia bacterium]